MGVREFSIRLEVHHGPSGEIWRLLAKGEVDYPLGEGLVFHKHYRDLAAQESSSRRGRSSLQDAEFMESGTQRFAFFHRRNGRESSLA